jgi:hypothetical protein
MDFKPSTTPDIDTIFDFYDLAIEYQKTKFNKHWKVNRKRNCRRKTVEDYN